jgi:Tol biopolymer transport system component
MGWSFALTHLFAAFLLTLIFRIIVLLALLLVNLFMRAPWLIGLILLAVGIVYLLNSGLLPTLRGAPPPTPAGNMLLVEPPTSNLVVDRPASSPVLPAQLAKSRIVFTSDSKIYVMNADGSNQTRLTNNPGFDSSPACPFDGSQIAFASWQHPNYEIYVMNADGSNQTHLTNSPAELDSLAWFPDGSRIAFTSGRDSNATIYVMNADGSNQTRLTNNPATGRYPTWSPDGRRIAFDSDRDGRFDIYVMGSDGSNQTNLTNSPDHHDWAPALSPDGSRIAFTSDRDGYPEIYVMDADGSNPTRLTNNSIFNSRPAWSPDGSRIAFESQPDGNPEIYVMNADGSNQTRLTNNPGFDSSPAWCSTADSLTPTAISTAVPAPVIVSPTPPILTQKPTTAGLLRQWATAATASSEYSNPKWSAMEATGAPNTTSCADNATAWAPRSSGVSPEWIELEYSTPVKAIRLRVHETYNSGLISQIDLKDSSDTLHTVWTGTDTTPCPGWFEITFPKTSFPVQGVKIHARISGWEEIDAVELIGEPMAQTPTPITTVISTQVPAPTPEDTPQLMRQFKAQLDGDQVIPPRTTNTTGEATFQLRDETYLDFTFNLVNVKNVVEADIRCAPAGENAAVGVMLFGPIDSSGGESFVTEGTITEIDPTNGCGWGDMATVVDAMQSGRAYVNVYGDFPGGEIRGQIEP